MIDGIVDAAAAADGDSVEENLVVVVDLAEEEDEGGFAEGAVGAEGLPVPAVAIEAGMSGVFPGAGYHDRAKRRLVAAGLLPCGIVARGKFPFAIEREPGRERVTGVEADAAAHHAADPAAVEDTHGDDIVLPRMQECRGDDVLAALAVGRAVLGRKLAEAADPVPVDEHLVGIVDAPQREDEVLLFVAVGHGEGFSIPGKPGVVLIAFILPGGGYVDFGPAAVVEIRTGALGGVADGEAPGAVEADDALGCLIEHERGFFGAEQSMAGESQAEAEGGAE